MKHQSLDANHSYYDDKYFYCMNKTQCLFINFIPRGKHFRQIDCEIS